MKIGLVLPSLPGYSETFFRNKILGLQQNGHKVILFVNNSKSENNYLNSKVIKAPNLGGNKFSITFNSFIQILKTVFVNPKKSFKLYKLSQEDGIPFNRNIKQIISNQFLLSEKLDWLHFGFGTMALGRENIARAINAKMAVSFRGFDYYVFPVKNKNCYNLLFSKKVKFHVLSDGMIQGLKEKGISRNDVFKITPAVDIPLFNFQRKKENIILHITTIARLHWIKGLEYTLEALALLKNENINFHYTIVGEGIEKERLQFAAYQLGLSKNVTFTGKLSPNEVRNQLQQTDIYLQYSIQEGFCNAVLEAQAMGLLCVVSDAEGLSENILDNETGWVVKKRNPALLADKIKKVIALSEEEKQHIRRKAVERVQKEFNLEKQKQEFLMFYE